MSHKVAQLVSQLVHMTSCEWLKIKIFAIPIFQRNIPHFSISKQTRNKVSVVEQS